MKESSCSIQLLNKTNHYMAFKVKTNSPKKYSVRPKIGILDPNTSFNFTVIMKAQEVVPTLTDLVCKDKFLVKCVVVPEGTTEDDISSSMFAKQEGKLVAKIKLEVIIVNAQQSAVSLSTNGTPKQNTIGRILGLVDGMLEETGLFILRTNETISYSGSSVSKIKQD